MNRYVIAGIFAGLIVLSGRTPLLSQPLTINTLAGYAGRGTDDGAGSNARFNTPWGVAADTNGNLYVADTGNHTIRKITPGGVATTLAGLAGVSGSNDGTNSGARFNQPYAVAVDSGGTVYVADSGNHTIRKVTAAGVVTTFAGAAGVSGSGNGTGTNAQFYLPQGIAVDNIGNVFVADTLSHTIRKITPAGAVSAFAGLAGSSGSGDGSGSGARFYQPQGLTTDGSGNLYVADTGNNTIRKITAGGAVTTLAGSAPNYGSTDATGTNALFYQPQGVAVDGAGNVYVSDGLNQTIRRVTGGGVVTTLAGAVGNYGSADGMNGGARFWNPAGVAVSGTNTYVADTQNGTIRKVAFVGGSWVVTTLAGSSSTGIADGTQDAARFFWPAGAAVDSASNTYVADTENCTIRKITPNGSVSTFAGLPGNPGSADGTGGSARFYGPQGVAVDSSGNVYVADTANHTIRKITPAGVVTTLAGSPGNPNSFDGTGGNAQFYEPQAVAVDSSGNVYVADTWNHTIRKITSGGVATTLAGLAGNFGSADGTNSAARFYWPAGVAVDGAGNVYVADYLSHTIRKITSGGLVSTLAGLPGVWGNADGTNSNARFFQPQGVAVDSGATIYVADSGNHAIRKLTIAGTNCTVTTVAGLPGTSGTADGVGSNARFNYSAGAAVDAAGYLYVADSANNTIRVDRAVPLSLQLAFLANQVQVSWPVSGTAFTLETASSVAPGALWTPVLNGVTISGSKYVLTTNSTDPAAFYRLHKP